MKIILFIRGLYDKLKNKINIWIDNRLLKVKLKKYTINKETDLLIIKYENHVSPQYVERVRNVFNRVMGEDLKAILVDKTTLELSVLPLKDQDIIKVVIPAHKFYQLQKTNKLEEEGNNIRAIISEQGITNKIALLPSGYEYKKEDYEMIYQKITDTNAKKEKQSAV